MSDQEYQELQTRKAVLWRRCQDAEKAAREATSQWCRVDSLVRAEANRREVERLVQQRLSEAKEMGKALACGCRSLEEAR